MDRALVTSPRVGGFGSGRQDPDVTGQVQWRVRNAVPEKTLLLLVKLSTF